MRPITRRSFIQGAAATVVAAGFPYVVPSSALGAEGRPAPSNRIAVGCIGVGPQGNGVMGNFLREPDAQVVAVCDVNRPRRDETKSRVDKHYGTSDCASYADFRELLGRDDIDAVIIASPDHWHVLHGLAAARAGKDMYIEKPLGVCMEQDRALREAIRIRGNVFQFGTQQRSSREFRHACELVRNGRIGRVDTIKVAAPPSADLPVLRPAPVPDGLDYEMWLGPAPWAPYCENRNINNNWWHNSDYAVGFIAGWGIHHVDIAQWGNDADLGGPVEYEGRGVFPTEGFCDCATSWTVECKYPNGVRMLYTDDKHADHGIRFIGTEGWVYVKRGFIDAQPKSLLQAAPRPEEVHLYNSAGHARNFLDCVKTRAKTVCPIEVAVRSDAICFLSDIAIRLRRKLKWDLEKEQVAGAGAPDDEANRMLRRAMREPWRL